MTTLTSTPDSNSTLSDQDLAIAAQSGDRDARNDLYMRLLPAINNRLIPARRLALYLVHRSSTVDVEDVQQEAFLIFCRLLDEWDAARADFVPYLLTMLPRRAYAYVRESQHLRSTAIRWTRLPMPAVHDTPGGVGDPDFEEAGYPAEIVAENSDPAEQFAAKERWNELAGQLSRSWARLLRLRFWEDKSSRQIAAQERVSQRTVNRMLQMSLTYLASQVKEQRQKDA